MYRTLVFVAAECRRRAHLWFSISFCSFHVSLLLFHARLQAPLICKLKAFWECSPLPQRAFFPPPSLLCLQFTPASGFQALPLNYFALQKAISSSSAAFPLFLTLLFLPMCRVFPGVAAAVLVGRCCTAAPLLAAVVAAAWGVWGSEGASTGGATSKRTRWSCTRKSLPHLPHPPAPHLWSPVPRSTPAPPMSRRPGADKEVF